MIEDRPELWDTPIEQLELWEEANVRKTDVLFNIEELAGNIKRYGVQVPLLVKEVEQNKKYLVFSGQRRLKACEIAGVSPIPCLVFKNISVTEAKILSFSENQYREAITIDDKSNAANQLFVKFRNIGRVALVLGVHESTVRDYLKWDAVPEELKKFTKKEHGKLSVKEIEDIYVKFPDLDRAKTVAKKLGSIKKGTKPRRKFHAAVRESTSSDDVRTVSRRADRLANMKEIELLLPYSKYKTIEKVAFARKITDIDLLIEIIEKWVEEYESGRHR